MTKYTVDNHALPYPEGVDKVAVHSDIQALAVKTGIAITQEAARTEQAAKEYTDGSAAFKGTLPAGSDAYAQLSTGWYAIPTPLAVQGIQNLPPGAGPGTLHSYRIGSGLTELRYSESDGRFGEFKATAGPSGVIRPWTQVDLSASRRKAYDQLTRPGSGNMVETTSAVHVRLPYIQAVDVPRFRLCLRNFNERNNITYTGALSITGIYYGEEELTPTGEGTGRFKGAPTLIPSLNATPANGNIFGTSWVDATLKARTRYLFSIGYTCAAGQENHLGYGGCWRTGRPADAAVQNPAGMTRSATAPLDVFVEFEVDSSVPVWAFPGDSLVAGVGADMPVLDSFVKKFALNRGVIGINMGQSGSGMNEWVNPANWKYGKLAYTGTTPDVCFAAIGSNNIFGGMTLAQMQALFADFITVAREKISPIVYLSTVMPRNGAGLEAQEAVRKQYNTWLEEELPGDAQMVFDFAASVADPSNPSRMDPRWLTTPGDTTHPGTSAYARNAAVITGGLVTPASKLTEALVEESIENSWDGRRPYTIDQTAGRVITVWDYLNNREQMIYGDTGDRDISALLVNATGRVVISRAGNTVTLDIMAVVPTSNLASGAVFITIPAGFRPAVRRDLPLPTNATASSSRSMYILDSGAIGVWAPATTDSYRISLSYRTANPWPTSLPGTAVGAVA